MKLVEKFVYQKLSRNDGGPLGRVYLCPAGNKLPSVTTILDNTKSAESIQAQVSRPEPAKIDVPVLEVENTNRATIDRFRSRAEDDILAALAGV